MILQANCKINIGLDIIRRREDGFHDLVTLMYPIRGLYDVINIELTDSVGEIQFHALGMVVDCPDDSNLSVRAARLMQQRYGADWQQGVSITLDKRIPFGAGLGGGSSDATSVILGLNELFELSLPESELIEVAAMLGSDTPFFLRNAPQLCNGRGEVMEHFPLSLEGLYIALIKPEGVSISTREAFSGIRPATPELSLNKRLFNSMEQWQQSVKNDFEPHIFEAYPILRFIKEQLLASGAIYASMSGSGSTIYGLFKSDPKKIIESTQLSKYLPYIYKL